MLKIKKETVSWDAPVRIVRQKSLDNAIVIKILENKIATSKFVTDVRCC